MMTYNEALIATLDQLTDELAAAGWDSTQQTRGEAFAAVVALIAETSPNSLPAAYHTGFAAAEAGDDECEIVAQQEGEFSTSYVGVNEDGELVKWSRNGGSRGAHDRMDGNRGEWHETYDVPDVIEPLEWLRLAVEYGCDDVDSLMVDAIDLGDLESDAESDEAHWLDAAEQCWSLPVYSIDIGGGKRLAWSDTDEAGIDDVTLIDSGDWDGFAESIAAELGEVVDVEAGEHYTNHGVQYQHQAPGNYDRDGFRIVVRRREDD